ncbi:hypothetical protein [Streptomyces sp. NPDC005799]|uniref:hypothetical protein n=1 Tax=Streptomyces sp. NPDC005799 TaxID=3154678 RepID=UPI0033F67360
MKAVRLHGYDRRPELDEVPDPVISSPLDVIVKIGGAGVCRTARSSCMRSGSASPGKASANDFPHPTPSLISSEAKWSSRSAHG